MSYQSRSDFIFNIRDFAESLHVEDIKALNEGLGIGEIRKSERKYQPIVENRIPENHLPDPSRIADVSVQHVTQKQRTFSNSTKRTKPKRKLTLPHVVHRLLLRTGAHVLDLALLSSVMVALMLFIKRLGHLQGMHGFERLFNFIESVIKLPLLEAVGFLVGALYGLFLLFWICFRIVGLKTPGELLLVKEPNSSASTRN